ncbi:DNA-methyltransferase [Micromonospora tulbaghiae]|uniref:DNA-methyltransferase n=1 Tax=Micromonospora tulbaghiae TaxID=479978 RepID=UPI0033C6BC22
MNPYYADDTVTLHHGDSLDVLRTMPDASVDCVVTSPPYFWMRDYGEAGQYGLEPTPQQYLDTLAAVMAEARRVLAADGTLWLNLGDAHSQRKAVRRSSHQEGLHGARGARPSWKESRAAGRARMSNENVIAGQAVPEKSLMMLPERIAIAMIDGGWLLRSKVVWAKTFAAPDPAADRLASKWEPLYLFAKSPRYWFDRAALNGDDGDVWRLAASSGAGDHTASYPLALPERCIRVGCKPGGVVLDPFSGSGTTGQAALALGRRYVGIDLSAAFHDLALRTRLAQGELIVGAA